MAKSLGISPSLFVIHEETMSSSTCRAVRTIAEDCIWDHTNPKYYRHIFQAEQVNNELMLSLHPRMLIGFNWEMPWLSHKLENEAVGAMIIFK